jgi:hypothetical protein|tara:strand:- start:247 stop:435 length:189 start_codon:yes stop_codon:yes gene_type:complete
LKTLIIILALALTGCNELGVAPPPFYVCEENESLLFCDDESLTECQGFLEDKPLIIIEETEL